MHLTKANKIYSILKKQYPGAKCALRYSDPLELLVATILSAQCTDVRVNIVTEDLFEKYRTVDDFADADVSVFEQDIRSTGFYKNKAKNIIAAAGMIRDDFGGQVPDKMEDLIKLPGVARKTANIILYNIYNKNEGIAVDTHVKRLSGRLGLSENKDPVKVEKDLMSVYPSEKWGMLSHLLIEHGRKVCNARNPLCGDCSLTGLCLYYASSK